MTSLGCRLWMWPHFSWCWQRGAQAVVTMWGCGQHSTVAGHLVAGEPGRAGAPWCGPQTKPACRLAREGGHPRPPPARSGRGCQRRVWKKSFPRHCLRCGQKAAVFYVRVHLWTLPAAGLLVCLYADAMLFDCCCFGTVLEIQARLPAAVCSAFRVVLAGLGSLHFRMAVRIGFSVSVKKPMGLSLGLH